MWEDPRGKSTSVSLPTTLQYLLFPFFLLALASLPVPPSSITPLSLPCATPKILDAFCFVVVFLRRVFYIPAHGFGIKKSPDNSWSTSTSSTDSSSPLGTTSPMPLLACPPSFHFYSFFLRTGLGGGYDAMFTYLAGTFDCSLRSLH